MNEGKNEEEEKEGKEKEEGNKREMKGEEMVIKEMIDKGVERILGYKGGEVIKIYEGMFKKDKIKKVMVRNEKGEGNEEEGYER